MSACRYGECDGSGFLVDRVAFSTRACRCRPQLIAETKARRLAARIPRRYAGVSFDRPPVTLMDPTLVGEVRRYVADIDANLDRGRGLWFVGDVGTGKTTLAMLVSKAALEAGRSVAIYSLPRLLSELRKTYDDSSDLSYLQLLDSLGSVDLLHIDDVGAERSNEWVLEQLYSIVNTRYEDEKAIVITTNLQEVELREQIRERTVSRLLEICGDPLGVFGEDQRRPDELRPGAGPGWRAAAVQHYGHPPFGAGAPGRPT